MQGVPRGIDVHRQITNSQEEECRPGSEQSHDALLHSDQVALAVHQFDAPGKHTKCLSAACPEPEIECAATCQHEDEQKIAQQRIGLDLTVDKHIGIRAEDELHHVAEQHPDRGYEEGVIEQSRQAPQQAGARGYYRVECD